MCLKVKLSEGFNVTNTLNQDNNCNSLIIYYFHIVEKLNLKTSESVVKTKKYIVMGRVNHNTNDRESWVTQLKGFIMFQHNMAPSLFSVIDSMLGLMQHKELAKTGSTF